jgi:cytochrome P450
MPFGGGRRICPGYQLAPAEIKIAVASLVRQFEFAIPPPSEHSKGAMIVAHGMVEQVRDNYVLATPLTEAGGDACAGGEA